MSRRKRRRVQILFPQIIGIDIEAARHLPMACYGDNKAYAAGADFSSQAVGPTTNLNGLSFTRSSSATTYDESIGVVSTGIGVDVARIAKDANGNVGLLVEPSRTNHIINSGDITATGWNPGTSVDTPGFAVAPDGTMTAVRSAGSAGQYARYFTKPSAHPSGTIYACSMWCKGNGGGAPNFMTALHGVTAAVISPLGPTWARVARTATDTSGIPGNNFAFVDGRDWTPNGGVAAVSHDLLRWAPQVETTPSGGSVRWSTSYFPTSGAVATRSADMLTVQSSSSVKSESLRFYAKIVVPASRANLGEGTGTTLTVFKSGSYYVQINTTTGIITVSARNVADSAFVTDTTTTGIAFAAGNVVEFWCVLGGNVATTIKYRINGNPATTLSMTSVTSLRVLRTGASPIGSSIDVLHNAGADMLPGIVQVLRWFNPGQTPGGF